MAVVVVFLVEVVVVFLGAVRVVFLVAAFVVFLVVVVRVFLVILVIVFLVAVVVASLAALDNNVEVRRAFDPNPNPCVPFNFQKFKRSLLGRRWRFALTARRSPTAGLTGPFLTRFSATGVVLNKTQDSTPALFGTQVPSRSWEYSTAVPAQYWLLTCGTTELCFPVPSLGF